MLVDAEKKLMVTNFHVVGDSRTAIIFFPELQAGRPVVIEADDNVPSKVVAEVLDAVRDNGAKKAVVRSAKP